MVRPRPPGSLSRIQQLAGPEVRRADAAGVEAAVAAGAAAAIAGGPAESTGVSANEFIPRWSKGTITIGTPQPTIGLNPTSMVFNGTIGTANPAAQPLAITNTGAGTLSWTAITTQPWLSVNPTSGSGNLGQPRPRSRRPTADTRRLRRSPRREAMPG